LVTVTVEDAPGFELRLSEHLALDLSIDVAHVLLNVEAVGSARTARAHEKFASLVLEAFQLLRVFVELQAPELLLLDTLGILFEVLHQVFDFLDLCLGIGVHDLSQIFHQSEVGAHRISESSQLAELRDEGDLIARLSVLVDEQRLIGVADAFIVASLVIVGVTRLSTLLVESG